MPRCPDAQMPSIEVGSGFPLPHRSNYKYNRTSTITKFRKDYGNTNKSQTILTQEINNGIFNSRSEHLSLMKQLVNVFENRCQAYELAIDALWLIRKSREEIKEMRVICGNFVGRKRNSTTNPSCNPKDFNFSWQTLGQSTYLSSPMMSFNFGSGTVGSSHLRRNRVVTPNENFPIREGGCYWGVFEGEIFWTAGYTSRTNKT